MLAIIATIFYVIGWLMMGWLSVNLSIAGYNVFKKKVRGIYGKLTKKRPQDAAVTSPSPEDTP